MMHNYDIKFLNKEITPFGGLSLLQVPKRSAIKECISRRGKRNNQQYK